MKIAVIGGGNMGYAFSKSFIEKNVIQPEDLVMVEKNEFRCNYLRSNGINKVFNDFDKDLALCDFVILAVKPQSFTEVSKRLKTFLLKSQSVISIMAGVNVGTIEEELGLSKIVRVMGFEIQ